MRNEEYRPAFPRKKYRVSQQDDRVEIHKLIFGLNDALEAAEIFAFVRPVFFAVFVATLFTFPDFFSELSLGNLDALPAACLFILRRRGCENSVLLSAVCRDMRVARFLLAAPSD